MNEKDFEHRLTQVEERSKSNTKRLNNLEELQGTLTDLVTSVATIAQKQTDMTDDMKEMKAEVKCLAGKPGKRWEAIVEKALTALVAGLVAYALMKFGIG
ncbi:MAG: hypothetical protein IJO42_00790 [Clostridia bacterium]|nr:hypothetical protein [Clostridia bacterium]